MTFEEFLSKKKIDSSLFRSGEQFLFLEFESHFEQMGEKSFDHSKKFWFNKLRRAYPLKEVPKPIKAPEPIAQPAEISTSTDVIVPTKATNLPSAEAKTTYKPRFKAAAANNLTASESEEAKPKPLFKPRFRAGLTSAPKEQENAEIPEQAQEQNAEEVKPAAYKPRFKAAIKAKESPPEGEKDSQELKEEETTEPKPAYKPRFKPSMIKKKEE